MTNHSADVPSVSEICARVHERVESVIVERRKNASIDKSEDQDRGKGAMEQDSQNQGGNTSMQVNWGTVMRMQNLKNADSDLSG